MYSRSRRSTLETLEGTVERIKYSTPDGYAVLELAVEGERVHVIAVGQLAGVGEGERLRVEGAWFEHPRFGRQLKVADYRAQRPTSDEGLLRYLQSGVISGIGKAIAQRLVDALGGRLFELAERDPLLLMQVPGIGKKRAKAIARALVEQRDVRDTMVFLQGLGLGPGMAARVLKEWGGEARQRLEADPYRLVREVEGFGFTKADELARGLGIQPDSPSRLAAGLLHVLEDRAGLGDTVVSREQLFAHAEGLLRVDRLPLERACEQLLSEGALLARDDAQGEAVLGLPKLVRAEEGIARHVARLLRTSPLDGAALAVPLQTALQLEGLALTQEQQAAVLLAGRGPLTVITGGPGTGKTTVLRTLVRLFEQLGEEPALCAPTGRAAKRLAEATGAAASTVHRLLGFRGGGFEHNEREPLRASTVIVDEASMLDVWLTRHLLAALPDGATLVLVGDADQLPSVGPGNVLADLIGGGLLPVARLTTIFRQEDTSRIVLAAHQIRRGVVPEPSPSGAVSGGAFHIVQVDDPERARERVLEVCCDRIPRAFGLDARRDVQVLSPMHRGAAGTVALNRALQARLNPAQGPVLTRGGDELRVGDKVMQVRNDHEREVFNGDLGWIVSLDKRGPRLQVEINNTRVDYEAEQIGQLALAYCISIHKSQGSEYPAVVVPLLTQHYVLLQRNLLYTAVTRARSLVVLVGSAEALRLAVRRADGARRCTLLQPLLAAASDAGLLPMV